MNYNRAVGSSPTEVVDSWEDIDADSIPLPKPLQREPQKPTDAEATSDYRDSSWFNSPLAHQPEVRLEGRPQTQFQPQIKILNRSKTNGLDNASANTNSPSSSSRKPLGMMSFEEKQRFYAEARRRILGEAPEPETPPAPLLPDPVSSPNRRNGHKPQSPGQSVPLLPGVGQPPTNALLRTPLGPDGTRGFGGRRK